MVLGGISLEQSFESLLGDVATVTMGTSPRGDTYNHDGIGLPLLNGPTEFGLFHPSCTLFTTDSKRECRKGDLIFCVRGSTTGRMNWADQVYSLGRGVCSIRGKASLDTKYVSYCLYSKLEALLMRAGGATFPNLTKGAILTFPIPYSPHRHKIAAILSTYDDLIENNTRRIQILEEIARLIYREWFVHFRFPGHEGVQMVDSEMGLIPEGWEVKPLGDIAEEVRRTVEPGEVGAETPYVGLAELPQRSIILSKWGEAGDAGSTKLVFHKGEILFGKIRPYLHKVCVAPVDGICSTDTIVIASKAHDWFPLVVGCTSSDEFVEYATQTSQGTKMPRANWQILTQYPVALPSESILRQFNELMKDVIGCLENAVFRNRLLRRTRDLLLPRLISGGIDVSELEIDTGGLD